MSAADYARISALIEAAAPADDLDEASLRRLLLKATLGAHPAGLDALSVAIDEFIAEFGLLQMALITEDKHSAGMSRRSLHSRLAVIGELTGPPRLH